MYRVNHILEWKIPNQDDYNNVVNLVSAKYNHLHSLITEQFGPNGWFVLCLFAFFLMLILVIYIKSIIDALKTGNKESAEEEVSQDGLFYSVEDSPVQSIANDNSGEEYEEYEEFAESEYSGEETEEPTEEPKEEAKQQKVLRSTADDLEKELSLSLLKASQENIDEEEQQKISSDIRKKIKVRTNLENAKVKELQTYLENKPNAENADTPVPLDANNNPISLIINLLGRGVSVPKINQSLYYNYQNYYNTHDIIHMVQSVCNFIGLCNAGKFDYLPQRQLLPENDAAIYAWAEGDCSLALILLQSYLNQLMEQSKEESGVIRDMTYALASNCSCIMGDIAKFKDLDLAHNSFELATELSSQNVTAWCRLGDMYMLEGTEQKAMIAYQNVIDIADEHLYACELAHAKQQLAAYYRKQEVFNKAEQFQKESKTYYEGTGIYYDLTKKEILAYQAVSAASAQNLRQYIYSLLNGYLF